jgi:dethiobiotin synthetase
MQRVVVLGAGTGVGKTWVSVALVRALRAQGAPALGLKPIESGTEGGAPGADASALAAASGTAEVHQLYSLRHAVSPHLAADLDGLSVSLERARDWIGERETLYISSHSANHWSVIETAGGVFSPLAPGVTNFELARKLEPAFWVLVAADALGVLHDLTATLEAMRARGRLPNACVLSQARAHDASTGTNARELQRLGIVSPLVTFARDQPSAVEPLVHALRAHYEAG